MKNILLETTSLNLKEITNTEKEIKNQPKLWKEIYERVLAEKNSIAEYLNFVSSLEHLNILITGAGTSAFIGLTLVGSFKRNLKRNTSAVSTTDLVTHPLDYLDNETPVLLVSFARSGNSPESVAVTRIADEVCSKVFHLIITCDESGELARFKTSSPKYVFVLPSEANDKGLAMTGSYSGMLLAGLLIARINNIESYSSQVDLLVSYGKKLLGLTSLFEQIAGFDFGRVVFLGSGPLFGTATESHLKIQELTDGKIICKKDSFLGFRHGPRAVIDKKTLLIMLFSNNQYVFKYEVDFAESLNSGEKPLYTLGIFEKHQKNLSLNNKVVLSDNNNLQLDEEFLSVCYVLPAQMLGFYKSLQLGLNPDMPSISGSISRVVTGVTIYPFNLEEK